MKVKLPHKEVPMLWLWELSSHSWSLNSLSTEHVLTSQMSCLCPWPTSTTLGKQEETPFYLLGNLLTVPYNIQPLAKGISSNPRVEFGFGFFFFHLYWCLILFFFFNITDSVAWYGRGVYRPKHPLRVYCLLVSSKMMIKEWFRSKGTLKKSPGPNPPTSQIWRSFNNHYKCK